ncbi:MAG: hypothetical protein U5R06_05700 [candidate division KSB1 bacterium]|nr:hypothetical protein [candidate division KSB1 bacterium]
MFIDFGRDVFGILIQEGDSFVANGIQTARIQPQPGTLTSSRIKVPTICGPVQADYQRDGRRQVYRLYILRDMKTEFHTAEGSQRIMIIVVPHDKKAIVPMLVLAAVLGSGIGITGAWMLG